MADNSGWHSAAVYDLTNTDLSYDEIARKYGRHRDTIIRLKNQYNVTRKLPARKGHLRTIDREAIDPQHRTVGIKLTMHRGSRSHSEMAELVGVSIPVLRNMELGLHAFTLAQLTRISKVTGLSLNELITPVSVLAGTGATGSNTVRKT